MTTVTRAGTPIDIGGTFPAVGSKAPSFTLANAKLEDVTLADFEGKRKVLNIVPSLDTPTCATSTRKFNELASKMDNTVVLSVSADLPFAASRFCVTEGLENVLPLSTFRSDFATDYGVAIESGPMSGLTARAVVLLDTDNVVRYTQLVPEIKSEPDYDAAIAALKAIS